MSISVVEYQSSKVPALGRYRLERRLGSGSMGDVWEAEDTLLERRVAIKILKVDGSTDSVAEDAALAKTRFLREARVAAALRHPNIVVAHDVGEVEGTCFFVMELVDGHPLRALLGGRVSIDEKIRWLREIADALSAMHEKGVIHRDVKPENVIIRTDRSACLVDLGIAKWTKHDTAPVTQRQAETAKDVIVGTPDYLPPETCYAGFFDELGDQYAWAVTAYELLANAHPSEVLNRRLTDRHDIPLTIASVVERARSRLPASRFPNMRALVHALMPQSARTSDQPIVIDTEPATDSEKAPDTISDPRITPPPSTPRPRAASSHPTKRRTVILVAGAALATVALHGVLLVAYRQSQTRTKDAVANGSSVSAPPPSTSSSPSSWSAPESAPIVAFASVTSTAMAAPVASARAQLRLGMISVDGSYSDAQKKEFIDAHRARFSACIRRAEPICHVYRYSIGCEAHPDGKVDSCAGGVAGPRVRGADECSKLAECLATAIETHVTPYPPETGEWRNVGYEIRVER